MLTKQSALRKDERNAYSGMEHRHFATIAAIIKAMPNAGFSGGVHKETALHFAGELQGTNHKFDRQRFLTACGL